MILQYSIIFKLRELLHATLKAHTLLWLAAVFVPNDGSWYLALIWANSVIDFPH